MKEKIKDTLEILLSQFSQASDVIEYVSFLTAAIFSVLTFFSIFLAHQYTDNISRLRKLTGQFQEIINNTYKSELKPIINDIKYYSNMPSVVKDSIEHIKISIITLMIIWGASALALLAKEAYTDKGVQVISIVLIISISILFIYFCRNLIKVLDAIKNGENDNIIDEKSLLNLNELVSKELVKAEDVIHIEEISIEINRDNINIELHKNYDFHHYYIVLNISAKNGDHLMLGQFISNETNHFRFEKSKSIHTYKRFIDNHPLTDCDTYFKFVVNGKDISYKGRVVAERNTYKISVINECSFWSLPQEFKNKTDLNQPFDFIELKGI